VRHLLPISLDGVTAGLEGDSESPIEGRSPLTDHGTSTVEERRARRQGLRQRRRRTRALTMDLLLAGALAALALALAPGLGVVLFFALPILVIVVLWAAGERLLAGRRERAPRRHDATSPRGEPPSAEATPREAG